jgi:hypothetical protein
MQGRCGRLHGHQDVGRQSVQRRLSHTQRFQANAQMRRAHFICKWLFFKSYERKKMHYHVKKVCEIIALNYSLG